MHVSACVGERERERERGRCCINPAYSSSSSSSRLGLGIYCSLFYYCQTLFSLIKDPREKRSREDEESKRRSQPCSPGITSSWTHWCGQSRSRKHTLQPSSLPRGQACFFFFSPPPPPSPHWELQYLPRGGHGAGRQSRGDAGGFEGGTSPLPLEDSAAPSPHLGAGCSNRSGN